MTHQDALKDLSVERYLLGELTGDAREQFEDHLFDCRECAADVKAGVLFLEAAPGALRELEREAAPVRKLVWSLAGMWQGWAMGAALAACLAVIVYQSAVVVPGLRMEVAELQTPAVLAPLVLANAGARGAAEELPAVVATRHGFYALKVDVPTATGMSGYRCTLYSPRGEAIWHVDLSPEQVRDSVTIQVPALAEREGKNELRVEGMPGPRGDGSLVPLADYTYQLRIAK